MKKRDEWQHRKEELKTNSPLERQSSRMLLISSTGKVRLRLRSASLTAICQSASFPFPLTCFPLCCSGTSSVSRRTGWGRQGVGLSLQAGGEYWTCEWGTLLEDNPWGCSVQGPFYSPSVCLGKNRGSVSCIINEGGWRPIQQCLAAKVSPVCYQCGSFKKSWCSVYPHYGNDKGKARLHSTLAVHAV